ncbi:hypothetical protein F5Y05DRAFT_37610 [Hypoxylon sp. FL0543]|nr:hypothetical protein F5Y05DRAFT_37610 [Hypoxylon sp. FL0543]
MKIKPSNARKAPLEDASNRANQSPAKAADKEPLRTNKLPPYEPDTPAQFEEYATTLRGIPKTTARRKRLASAAGRTEKSRAEDTTASHAPSSRKRKAETSLEDDIAAYKQNLDETISRDTFEDDPLPSCQTVRNRINKLLNAGIMTKTEFSKAIGSGTNSVSSFLKQTGTTGGRNSCVYFNAWAWFRQREVAKLKMPDVKKRKSQEASAVNPDAGSSNPATVAPRVIDISQIHLDGEETDSVPIYDTCDEIRKKINGHLKSPEMTQAQLCRNLYDQLHAPKVKGIQSGQLTDFLRAKGSKAGVKSTVFYAAYVYFEKLRIAQGKPKSSHREAMENIWGRDGLDRTIDTRTAFLISARTQISFDRYGWGFSV